MSGYLARLVLMVGAATLIAGCGESQPPIGALGKMLYSNRVANLATRNSWMLPEASHGDLLYVSDDGTSAIYVFSYPGLRYVGMLTNLEGEPHGVCSDRSGNVFVGELNFGNNHVQEFAHGGTTPIETLDAPGEPEECSVDAATGNLAVAIYTYGSGPTGVAVYPGAQGSPALFSDPNFLEMTACSYDELGNLFVAGANADGFALAVLPLGSGTFTDIALKSKVNGKFLEPIQWEGKHLAIGSTDEFTHNYVIYRVAIAGATAKVVGSTRFLLEHGYFTGDTAFVIKGHRIALTEDWDFSESRATLWKYPRGGTKVNATRAFGSQYVDGVTVSVAPSR